MNWRLKYKYGITLEEYQFQYKKQKGVCKICKQKQKGVRYKWLSVDHNHKTGKVRGLLCWHCNKALGLFQDNIKNLKAAIRYLYV